MPHCAYLGDVGVPGGRSACARPVVDGVRAEGGRRAVLALEPRRYACIGVAVAVVVIIRRRRPPARLLQQLRTRRALP